LGDKLAYPSAILIGAQPFSSCPRCSRPAFYRLAKCWLSYSSVYFAVISPSKFCTCSFWLGHNQSTSFCFGFS